MAWPYAHGASLCCWVRECGSAGLLERQQRCLCALLVAPVQWIAVLWQPPHVCQQADVLCACRLAAAAAHAAVGDGMYGFQAVVTCLGCVVRTSSQSWPCCIHLFAQHAARPVPWGLCRCCSAACADSGCVPTGPRHQCLPWRAWCRAKRATAGSD